MAFTRTGARQVLSLLHTDCMCTADAWSALSHLLVCESNASTLHEVSSGCSWLGRGILMMFEALLTLEITSTVKAGETDFHRSLQLYRLPAAISLLACSGLYILGGMLCLGRRKRGVLSLHAMLVSA